MARIDSIIKPPATLRLRPLCSALAVAIMAGGMGLAPTASAQAGDGAAYAQALAQRRADVPAPDSVSVPARGGTVWPVGSCDDDGGPGTLRAVLAQVGEGDTVDLSALTCSTITLTGGTLDIGVFGDNHVYQLSIVGPGRDLLTIDGDENGQVLSHRSFNAVSARLDISDLSIRNGRYAGGLASCIDGNSHLTLTRVDVSDCHTTGGGPTFAAAVNAGRLSMVSSSITGSTASTTGAGEHRVVLGAVYARSAELVDSAISGNAIASESGGNGSSYFTAGGGLYVRGDLQLERSTISDNSATVTGAGGFGSVGGGVFVTGMADVLDSTLSGNAATEAGGGLFKAPFSPYGEPPLATVLNVSNSTISGNSAARGGGIASTRPLALNNAIVALNHAEDGAGGVLFRPALVDDVTFELHSTIIAGNTAGTGASLPADLGSSGQLQVTGSTSLVLDAGTLALPADTLAVAPGLLPLADNGGPTWTHALPADSPAVDAGANPLELAFDQRGAPFARVHGAAADIGAFEFGQETADDVIFRNGFEAPADPVVYLHDDGDGNTNQGPPSSFDPDMLWGNYYLTEPGGGIITEISVAFGPTFPSLANGPVTFWLLDDPDMDFDPRNATSLVSVTGTPDVFNDQFFTVSIPPTQVSGAFFVGASAKLLGGQDRPARVDTNAAGDKSWFFYAPEIADVIDDLASAPFGARMDDPQYVIYPGAFMIRAVGVGE